MSSPCRKLPKNGSAGCAFWQRDYYPLNDRFSDRYEIVDGSARKGDVIGKKREYPGNPNKTRRNSKQ